MRTIPLIILLSLLLAGCALPKVCFGDACVAVELATTPDQHASGLMWRESLDADAGMLFVFPTDAMHGFWMKNTLIPLDIIWLDRAGVVVHIVTAPPCDVDPCQSFSPENQSLYVLETNAGWAEKHDVRIGSTAALPLQTP